MTTASTTTQALPGIDLDLDTLEALERAATPGPWHWVNPETDQPRQVGEWRASLRTVEEFPAKFGPYSLPRFIVQADEIYAENLDANADFIATANPQTVLALIAQARAAQAAVPVVAKDKIGNTNHVGRGLDGMAQPFVGAIVLLETIAECGARAYIGDEPTPMRETCIRFANELRAAASQAAPAQPAAQPVQGGEAAKRWPFVEAPGQFTTRLAAAMKQFDLLGAVRHVLIENPPQLAPIASTSVSAPASQVAAQQAADLEEFIPVPSGLNRDELRSFILSHADTKAAAKAPAAQAVEAVTDEQIVQIFNRVQGRWSSLGGPLNAVLKFAREILATPASTPEASQQAAAVAAPSEPDGWMFGSRFYERGNPRLTDEIKRLGRPFYTAPTAAAATTSEDARDAALEPVEGDLLPPVGSKVLIHLSRQDAWVEHTVTGYYVWGAHPHQVREGEKNAHRVFVRVKDAEGYDNARLLSEVRPVAAMHATQQEGGSVA